MSSDQVAIVGIGMHKFGRAPGVSGRAMAVHAAAEALTDAGVTWSDVQVAFGGSYSSGDADTLVSELGLTGLPFINVWNGCGTGGSALIGARSAILSGEADLAAVIGFDKHAPGAFNEDPANHGIGAWYGEAGMMVTTQFFSTKIARYLHDHQLDPELLSLIGEKAYRNGALNPMAWRQEAMTAQQVADSAMVNHPLTKYMFCSPGEGAVALILASPEKAKQLSTRPVHLASAAFRSRRFGSYEVYSPWLSPDRAEGATTDAAAAAFAAAGVDPADVQVAQIQDTETGAEIMHMAETGLCAHGDQEKLIRDGATEIGGTLPINTDGGCLANGEPVGASGLRQVYESVLQLRGDAGAHQVPNDPSVAFTHVYGAPGIAACTVLTR